MTSTDQIYNGLHLRHRQVAVAYAPVYLDHNCVWRCKECDGTHSVHRGNCGSSDKAWPSQASTL